MFMVIAIITFWIFVFAMIALASGTNNHTQNRLKKFIKGRDAEQPELIADANDSPTVRRLRAQLFSIGLTRKSDLKRALLFRRFCYLAPFLMMGILFFMGFPLLQVVASGLCFGIIFIILPKIGFIRAQMKRRRDIQKHLPDTLDLLTLCLEAGLSFDSSLLKVAEEQERVSPNISREFKMTNQEILAGRSRKAALANLAERTNVDEIRTLVGAIQQSIKLGTSLIKTLRTQASTTRKKKREQIRATIMKTPVKLIFPLIFLIFPTLMIVILAPSLVNTFRHLSAVNF